jgi:hypothetical protein
MTFVDDAFFSEEKNLSFVPLRTYLYFNHIKLAVCTSFFYKHENHYYLITNWHNVTGREPDTLVCKSQNCAIPNRLSIEILYTKLSQRNVLAQTVLYGSAQQKAELASYEYTFQLYKDSGDSPTEPIWYEHPKYGRKIDIVAIPLNSLDLIKFEENEIREIIKPVKKNKSIKRKNQYLDNLDDIVEAIKKNNSIKRKDQDLDNIVAANASNLGLNPKLKYYLTQGLDVFVLGFPIGISGGWKFPIWKRGSIASDPSEDIDGLPLIFIDTATREGMSGSPVYVQTHYVPEQINSPSTIPKSATQAYFLVPKVRDFLGIYSGRVGNDPFKAQLGTVWKQTAIEDVITGASPGISSFDLIPLEP